MLAMKVFDLLEDLKKSQRIK